jgi:hypothetical protein
MEKYQSQNTPRLILKNQFILCEERWCYFPEVVFEAA